MGRSPPSGEARGRADDIYLKKRAHCSKPEHLELQSWQKYPNLQQYVRKPTVCTVAGKRKGGAQKILDTILPTGWDSGLEHRPVWREALERGVNLLLGRSMELVIG